MTITRIVALVVSLLAAGAATAQEPVTMGDRFSLDSKVMGAARNVIVSDPPGYAGATASFPVLYLTDAERQFGHTVTTVEFLPKTADAADDRRRRIQHRSDARPDAVQGF